MTFQACSAYSTYAMRYEYHCLSDTGRVRKNNEDAVFFDSQRGIALLADGMGGHHAGEVASAMAIAHIQADFAPWLDSAGRDADSAAITSAMADCARHANSAIHQAAQADAARAGMGTTLVFGVFLPARIFIGHVGDSRGYRWRGGALQRLTRDHSVVQEYLDAGFIEEHEAATAPYRGVLTRALGSEEAVEMDIGEHAPEPGDLYLLCSDGVTDMLADARIAELLAASARHPDNTGTLEALAERVIGAANQAGGRDNASLVLARVCADEEPGEGRSARPARSTSPRASRASGTDDRPAPAGRAARSNKK